MRKIYLLMILLISSFGFAQGTGNYNVSLYINDINVKVSTSGNCGSRLESWFIFSNAGDQSFFNQPIGDGQDLPRNWTGTFPSLKKLTKIKYYSEGRKWHGGLNSGCKNDNNSTESINVAYGVTEYYSNNYFTNLYNLRATLKIFPKLHIQEIGPLNPNNILPTGEKITIKSDTGFLTSEYTWQYSINPNSNDESSWVNLDGYYTASISVNAVDVLKELAATSHGKIVHFRQVAYNKAVKSNIVSYSVRISAPAVTSFKTNQPLCYDTKNGSVELVFNRTLLDGEQLNYTILDVDTNTPSDYNGILAINANKSFIIPNIKAGNYLLQLIGFKNGLSTAINTDFQNLQAFKVESPSPLDFTLSNTNVMCKGSSDGTITIAPTGGTRKLPGNDSYSINGGNWIEFPNNQSYSIKNLGPGTYKIRVRDMNGCVAKIQTPVNGVIVLGEEKVLEKTISEPDVLAVDYIELLHPTFFNAANGKLVAVVTGGTINSDNTYSYEWKNSAGNTMPTSAQYSAADKKYTITLANAPAGEYKLTVRDKNYAAALNKTGCTVIESSKTLIHPAAIEITLTQTQQISCNTENFEPVGGDVKKLSNAILEAEIIGGVKPYTYIWSKYNEDDEKWEELKDVSGNKISELSKGQYSLNVKDFNGIYQGTYNTIELVEAIPETITIVEPAKLELLFTSENVSCFEGNNGWAEVAVTGGRSDFPYTYVWRNSNGVIVGNTKTLSQLIKDTYYIQVTDKNGCTTSGSVEIDQPKSKLDYKYIEVTPPTFFGATNGRIVVEVTGGTSKNDKSYNYVWSNASGVVLQTTTQVINGIYTITLNGVPAGEYFLTITDENYANTPNHIVNCSILNSKKVLTDPAPIKITLEIKNSISCNADNEFGDEKDTAPNDGKRDESQDGILVAHVTGGITLLASENKGLPYHYFWKKQLTNGTWIDLTAIQDSIAPNLSHGNYSINIKDRNGIMLGTYVNNVLETQKDVEQFMQQPSKLLVTITHGDVFCNEGNDGWAIAHVTGGTPPYNYEWSNGVKIEENTFLTGVKEYKVFIKDARGCTTEESVVIDQPKTPITVNYTEVLNPSFYKATNGKIIAEVAGGTVFSDNTYWYEWKNSKGILQTSITTKFINGIYQITLNGVPEDTYFLTVRDAHYNDANNKNGCNVADSSVTLEQPEPLKVVFEVVRTISCNADNQFGNETDASPTDNQRDESQDGILVAHVTGGIQLAADKNNGLPYYYTWKKQLVNGSWIKWNEKDETAENISDGTYALNIEDANGIKLGTYINNLLTEEKDVTQYMPQPDKLTLKFTKLDVGCTTGDDGWAEVHVTGGTPPYTYEWTNGATIPKIENLTTNNYFVIATDAKGCVVQGSIFVGDPNGIFTTETVKNPTCFKGGDGSIVLNVTGGNLPYSYLWNTGATTKDLGNLKAGNYEVAITCPECCIYKKKFVLKDPEEIKINLGSDRTLCKDQSVDLDATIADQKAQYNWTSTNGFTSNETKVNVSKSGTYHVKVTTGLGCISEDEIVIKTSQLAISAEFLLSSQAYLDEEVILVNTSNPFGESTDWVIPQGVKVVEQKEKYLTLKFEALGVYSIGLKQTQGECYATYTKNITVEQRSGLPDTGTTSQFVLDFIVTPNPSNGNFKALVNLENNSAVNLRLFSTSGQNTMIQKNDSGKKKYEIDFETSLEAGMYILVLETGQQTMVKKIIIY